MTVLQHLLLRHLLLRLPRHLLRHPPLHRLQLLAKKTRLLRLLRVNWLKKTASTRQRQGHW